KRRGQTTAEALDTAAIVTVVVECKAEEAVVVQSRPEALEVEEPDLDEEPQAVEDERGVSADLVRAYLNGIGRTKLLTAEQEVSLSKRIEAALLAEERLTMSYDAGTELDPQLRRDLRTIVTEGRAAKNHLLEANL